MKLFIVIFTLISTSIASAATCKITTVTNTKLVTSPLTYDRSESEVNDLSSCINIAKQTLGITASVKKKNTEIKPARVTYSYYDSMTGIQYNGSLR